MKPVRSFSVVAVAIVFLQSLFIDIDAEPELDGIFSDTEWSKAKKYPMKDGGEAFMFIENNLLFLAFKQSMQGWAHVYLKHNDTIQILHASAALGTGAYKKENNGRWQPIRKFQWELRDRIYNNELKVKMNDFFLKNGWVSNNANTGSGNVLEFKIDISKLCDKERKIALLFTENKDKPRYFPLTINDDTIHPDVIFGSMPADRNFDLANWFQF